MPVRKPTLEEWFLAYQLQKLIASHVHIPTRVEIDVSRIAEAYRERLQRRPSWTAILVKGVALAAKRVPAANRAYLRTIFGDRIIEFDHISVNVPVLLDGGGGQSHLSVTTVRNADELRVASIAEQVHAAKRKKVDDVKLVKLTARGKNNLFMRTLLRIIHFVAYNSPRTFAKRAGGLSVSSLLKPNGGGGPIWSVPSFGPTVMTLALTDVRVRSDGRSVMEVGIGFDHAGLDGYRLRQFVDALHDVMTEASSDLDAFL